MNNTRRTKDWSKLTNEQRTQLIDIADSFGIPHGNAIACMGKADVLTDLLKHFEE